MDRKVAASYVRTGKKRREEENTEEEKRREKRLLASPHRKFAPRWLAGWSKQVRSVWSVGRCRAVQIRGLEVVVGESRGVNSRPEGTRGAPEEAGAGKRVQ